MRIAMVSEHASPLAALGGADAGGQNVHVAELARALGRRGHEVVVHTRRDDPAPARRVEIAANVTVDHVSAGPARRLPKDDLLAHMDAFGAELGRAWRRERPDVVHAHFWMSGVASGAAARPLRIPLVQTFHALGAVKRRHQGAADTSPPQRLEIERDLARSADRVLATCTDEVFELLRLGADRHRIGVVPCGVDLAAFCPDGPAAPRAPGRARVVSLGRLVERKGVGNVVEAMADLPGAELLIAGGPPARCLDRDPEALRLRALARAAGVADRVRLLGRLGRSDVARLLRSADAVACTPWYEPFGIVPLEAMACGVPVVASRVGGMIDTVVHEATGLHVAPRDPAAIAAALRRLLADRDLRVRLGRAGAARARERYSWDRIAAATRETYSALAAGAAATARTGARR